jgi:hypothetical protein
MIGAEAIPSVIRALQLYRRGARVRGSRESGSTGVFAVWLCIALMSVGCTIGSDGDNRAITTNSCLSPVCITTEAQKVCEDAPCQEVVTVDSAADLRRELADWNPDEAPADAWKVIQIPASAEIELGDIAGDLPLESEPLELKARTALIGGRTARQPGPLLYSTIKKTLFLIRANDVRISGLRIRGPDYGEDIVEGGAKSVGIYVSPSATAEIDHIEIDHNEIYGWKNEGIGVNDDDSRIPVAFWQDFWPIVIHDNYIHHNQEQDSAGYGVVIGNGAFALIDRNVFDYNRHAIAGGGSNYSGYRAIRNLVLPNGGRHKYLWWGHTHQFDMHGQESCGIGSIFNDTLFNCGTAGYAMEIVQNSFLYSAGAAIKIRGTPQYSPRSGSPDWPATCGAVVRFNVFVHDDLGDAVQQTETGLCSVNNRVGIDGSDRYGFCDFDGDGADDRFMATGETWWYASGGTGPWVYLNTSQRLLSELTLANFDGDNRCDVVSGDLISSGGTGSWMPR